MNSIGKFLALVFVFLLLSSLLVLTVTPVTVQAVPKPSVPQFSIKFFDNSYDVESYSTTAIDQYTGKEITTTAYGYHVDNRSIEITIKNQPFTPYIDADGVEFNLYYRVEVKGRFGDDWQAFGSGYVAQSSSGYTVVSQGVTYVAGAQLDFRVLAVICVLGDAIRDTGSLAYFAWGLTSPYIESEVSRNLSGTQAFTMPGGDSLSSSSQTTTLPTNPPTTPEDDMSLLLPAQPLLPSFMSNVFFLLLIGVLFVGVVVTVVLVFLRRHLKVFGFSDDFL